MIRYRYAQEFMPPAPFVNVAVRCLATGSRAENQPAEVDSAADRTVLPDRVVAALGLVEDGRLLFQGFGGQVVELPVFLVAIQVHDLAPVLVRAALGKGEPHILLGRDVLNAHNLVLSGPKLTLDIDRPPADGASGQEPAWSAALKEPEAKDSRLAEQWEAKGIEKALAKGALVGKIQMCQELLKLPLTPEQELRALPEQELTALLARLRHQVLPDGA